MRTYTKPLIVNYDATRGAIPALIAAAPLTVTFGVSLVQAAAAAAVTAAAALSGVAVGAAISRKGNSIIITEFTSALTARKNFSLT